ncbi:L,D-transpeptidase [Candidatus Peregrinibacteria bacterium]|nr:L,D-transpeptidase [Candidatus Peregrinibacteria bacterium]
MKLFTLLGIFAVLIIFSPSPERDFLANIVSDDAQKDQNVDVSIEANTKSSQNDKNTEEDPLHSAPLEFCGTFSGDDAPSEKICRKSLSSITEITSVMKRIEEKGLDKKFCDKMKNSDNLSFCRKKLALQNAFGRDEEIILKKRSSWNLSEEDCNSQKSHKNFELCQEKLTEQKDQCQNQITGETGIYVDLETQVLYGVKNCRVIVYTRILSGANATPTPPGGYKIWLERTNHWMQGRWFVQNALYYDGFRAVHDAEWRVLPKFWEISNRGNGGSHSCVNTPIEQMKIIRANFGLGDSVEILSSLPDDLAAEFREKTQMIELYDPSKFEGQLPAPYRFYF